jgi:hypothetical protein
LTSPPRICVTVWVAIPAGKYNRNAKTPLTNPNKTKQKSLDLLGFVRPNRDFSKGCEQKNKKNRLASQVVCKTSQAGRRQARRWFLSMGNVVAQDSDFRKKMHDSYCFLLAPVATAPLPPLPSWSGFDPAIHENTAIRDKVLAQHNISQYCRRSAAATRGWPAQGRP